MSYWRHHPEEYEALIDRSIARKLGQVSKQHTFDEEQVVEFLENMLDSEPPYRSIAYAIRNVLVDWAQKDIEQSERDYWGTMIDSAMVQRGDT